MIIDTRMEQVMNRIADLYATYPDIRNARPKPETFAAIREPGMRPPPIAATVMAAYADRPALGPRDLEPTMDESGRRTLRPLPEFATITYGELWARVGAIAAAWHQNPDNPIKAGDFIATLGFTSSDYTTLELAKIYVQ